MRKRSIGNLLLRNCKRGRERKWKQPALRRLRRARQFQKERKRLFLTPSSQFFNQRLERVVASKIRWRHQWRRARCVLRAVRWDDKSSAEFWEEFSEAVVAADSLAGTLLQSPVRKNRRALANTRRSEFAWIIFSVTQPGSRLLSLPPWPPSLPRRLPTSCT